MNSFIARLRPFAQRVITPQFVFFFIAVWSGVLLLGGIRFGDLSGYDDAAYAHEARVMAESGDWLTLHLNGYRDFDKPPLFIWLLAISFKIFGANDFAAKVPGVVCGWVTILLTYLLARELFGAAEEGESPDAAESRRWLPAVAMIVMATTQYFLKNASHAMTDVPFTFFFTLAIYFYARALKNNLFLPVSGAAIGLATLTRSPMGLFPLAIIGLHLLLTKRFRLLFSAYFAACVALAFLLPGAWFAAEYQLFGDYFISRHFGNFLAHSTAAHDAAARPAGQQALWYFEYFFLVVRLYIPWFPLMFFGVWRFARRLRQGKSAGLASAETLVLVWLAVVILPFSLADSKVLRYILPVFPAFAILAADGLLRLLAAKRLPLILSVLLPLLAATCIITTAFPNYLTRAGDMRMLAPIADAASRDDARIMLYTSGDLKWDYQTQLLWYGHRNTTLTKDLAEVEKTLAADPQLVVIMDKPTFATFSSAPRDFRISTLGESEKFVCFRRAD